MGLLQQIYQRIDSEGLLPELQDLYCQYGGRELVAQKLGIAYGTVGHVMRHYGINKSRSSRRSIEKYTGKVRDPFDGSDFGDYLIGYIIGDGSIIVKNGKVRGINISSSDYDHIVKIRDMWDESLKIYGPSKGNYSINCYDVLLAEKVMSYGIVPAKSKVGMVLTVDITPAMLRGLFDSDGSVTFTNGGKDLRMFIAGGRDYIPKFIEFIGTEHSHWIYDRGSFICVYYGAFSVVKYIRDLMYKDATIYIQRKYERFYKPDKYRHD